MTLALSKLSDLSLEEPVSGVQEYPLDLIDEDPDQPRKFFSEQEMKEMAESIKARGVKSPISLRKNPNAPGRFILNFGARRYRGSIMAGKATIPGFEDENANFVDQLIENIQRADFQPLEVAKGIEKLLADGMKKGEVAKTLGVSGSFVTQYSNLLALPECINEAFQSGRCQDVTVLYDLTTIYNKKANEGVRKNIAAWITKKEEITRTDVKTLRERLVMMQEPEKPSNEDEGGEGEGEGEGQNSDEQTTQNDKLSKPIVQVEVHGQAARLLLKKRPSESHLGWVQFDEEGQKEEVPLSEIKIVGIIEG